MRTLFYFLTTFLIFGLSQSYAKVIRVDNNEGASADYVKLQDAINNAEEGDSIYIVGSPNIYDRNDRGTAIEIRLNKQVTLIGPGYFLGENEQTQVKNQTAKVYRINIGEGADGAVLTGLDININSNSYVNINAERFDGSRGSEGPSNIKLFRNSMELIYVVNARNTLITQNYFGSQNYPIYLYANASSSVITNNIIITSNTISIYGRDNVELVNTVISNNTLSHRIYTVNGATIQNNIFISGGFYDSDNNNVKNNLFTTTQDAVVEERSTGNSFSNNIFSAVQANIFVVPDPSVDNQYQLASDSPATGQGIEGENLGAFGGLSPYKLSGLPAIPSIYDLTTSGVGSPAAGMPVQVKVKSHN
jgi:hypothetical protein